MYYIVITIVCQQSTQKSLHKENLHMNDKINIFSKALIVEYAFVLFLFFKGDIIKKKFFSSGKFNLYQKFFDFDINNIVRL